MNDKFRSRKFGLAASSLGLTFFGIAIGWIDKSVWVAVVGLVLGLYGAANVAEAAVNGKNGN